MNIAIRWTARLDPYRRVACGERALGRGAEVTRHCIEVDE